MRHRWLSLLLSSVVGLVLLAGAGFLVLSFETVRRLAPAGSGDLQLKAVTPWEARLSYQLPRGETWNSVYSRLTAEGWDIYDDGPGVLWPALMDNNRTTANFRRLGMFSLVYQWLTVRRVSVAPPVFTVEIVQCVRFTPPGKCA